MALIVNGTNTSSGASLPDAPADVLLDAGSPLHLVGLDGSGVGASVAYEDAVSTGLAEITSASAEGEFVVGDGAGDVQLASVDPAAVRAVIGVQDGPRLIPLFAYATADSATPVVQALAGFTPADYAITGRTTTLALDAIGSVTGAGLTATLEMLNAAGTTVATLTWTETSPTRKTTSVTLPGSAQIWRARVSCAGVVDPLTDYALLGGAHLCITWS